MTLLDKLVSRKPVDTELPPPVLLHYVRQAAGEKSRIHLRLDPGGDGTLIVNANRVLHLNPTAAFMAHMILEGNSSRNIVDAATSKYRVGRAAAEADLAAFS